MKALVLLAAAVAVFACAQAARATTYEVGDGKTYTSIGAVPWESLNAGDTVLIYYRATAYKEKFVLGRVGTLSQPITVRGVPDGSGNLPVLDGQSATTRLALETGSEARGIITMQQWTTTPPSCRPSYIVIENLEFKNASVPYTFTDDAGASQSYVNASAAIWIADGRNITVRNCYIHECGNGLFTYSAEAGADNWSQDILFEGNYINNCGNAGSVYEHGSYTESLRITFQYNHYGQMRGGDSGSIGNALKDRSAGMVIRYNWIEGGNRTMDIVDPEDSATLGADAAYEKSYMYGNILVERNDAGNRQVVHFGGDMSGEYRPKGYFYNNTVVSYRAAYTTLVMENGGSSSTFDCRNNIIYVTTTGSNLEISNDSDGVVNLRNCWMKTGWRASGSGGGTVNNLGGVVTGTSPSFVDESGQNFRITSGSQCVNAGTTLHADCASYPVSLQYVKHQGYETRPSDGTLDIGAYEYSGGVADLVITTTSLPGGTVGVAYSQTVSATGGVTPYSWSISGGSLPAGLSINSSSGVISGTPTTANTYNFTVRVQDSQGTPDSDTQALSIVISGGGSSATYQFTAADSESSTTSTSYQNKATLTFTPDATDDWVILGFAEYKGSSASYSTLVRMQVDAVEQAALTVEPKDTTDYQSFAVVKVSSLSAAAHTVTLDYRSENTGATARIRNARIVAIRKSALLVASGASDSTTALTTTLTNYATASFTPATAGDYLLIATAEFSANTGYSTQVQAKLGSTVLDNCLVESKDNTNYYTFASFSVANCPTSAQTLTVTAAKETGSTATHNIRRARAVAIRLAGSRFTGYGYAASDTTATTTSTSFQEKATRAFTATAAGNWLILASAKVNTSSASYSNESRVQIDNTTTSAQPLREPQDTTDYMNAASVDVRNLSTGAHYADIDYRSENAAATARINYAHIAAIPLAGNGGVADLVITTTSLPGGTVGTAYSQTVQATGGVTPYSWSISSGSLPAGLSINSSSGVISGTPTTANTYNFTVRVQDSQGTPDSDTQALSIVITSGGGSFNVTLQDGLSGYAGTTDNWLDSDYPTTNNGSVIQAHLQYGTQDRQIHRFDLSSIPSNATITSATMSFYVYNVTGGTPNVNCYRILTNWDEMQSTYNNRLTGTAWGTPGLLSGTDYAATAIASSGNISVAGWANFTITSTVQAWVNGSQTNYGVMYKLSSAGHCYTRMSEYTTDTSVRPKLAISYTTP